jgi:antitoxin (DNA-binding transcriptional repressor) of toxin-antitoxin stability system
MWKVNSSAGNKIGFYIARFCVLFKSMTTITPTQARVNLSSVLRRALKGDDIGIVVGGQVVALRPVEILSRDYAEREYGLTSSQVKTVAKKLHAKAQKAGRSRKSKVFKGDIEALLKD